MILEDVLVSKLSSATGLKVWPVKKPLKETVPCIVYKIVSDKPTISIFKNLGASRDRVQIIATHTTSPGLRTLVGQIDGVMIANKTDWVASVPTELKQPDYDEDTKVWSCTRDYFVFFYN